MATATGYSAGRVFLQVVPSYKNFMTSLRRDARGALGQAIADTFEKELSKAGANAGQKFTENVKKNVRSDALTEDLRKKLGAALDQVGDDSSRFGQKLKALQKDIDQTGRVTDEHVRTQQQLAKEMLAAGEATDSLAKKQRLLGATKALDPSTVREYTSAQKDEQREVARTAREHENAARSTRRHGDALRENEKDSNVAARGLGRLRTMLSGSANDSQAGANAFRFFNFAILGITAVGAGLVPVLAAVAGGLIMLGPILAGLGAAGGVAALGLSGVGDAVKALAAQQDATSSSNSTYARGLVNAARAVADARRSLKDAYRNSADGIARAIESQKDAERSLADAQRDAKKAQEDLTQARKDAAVAAEDLADRVAQNQLDERQGVIDLFQAYNQYGATMSDGGSTNLQKEQADIQLKQAELNLKRIREEQKQLADEKKKSDKDGIEGSDQVRAATDRLTDAIERQKNAQRGLVLANKAVTRARQDGARGIADAQRALTRAQEDYNYAAEGGGAASDKLALAMSKLSPAAQEFAKYLFSLRGGLQKLRAAAAEGFLPGLEDGMKRIIRTYAPGMLAWVKGMSTELGQLTIDASKTFTNPVWQKFFGDFGDATKQFTADANRGILGVLTGLAGIFDQALPSSRRLSTYISDIGVNFQKWTQSEDGRTKIADFFRYVDRVGPKVRDFFEALVKAIGNIGVSLAPVGESVLSFLTDFLNNIAKMDPGKVRQIAVGVGALVLALQSASGIMAIISVSAAIAAAPTLLLVGAVAALAAGFFFLGRSTKQNKKFFKDFGDSMRPLIKVVKDLGRVFKQELVKTWKQSLLPALRDISKEFKEQFLPALITISPIVEFLGKIFLRVFGILIRGYITALKDVLVGFMRFFSGLVNFFDDLFHGRWGQLWGDFKDIIFGAVQAIWGLINLYFYGKIFGGIKALFTKEMPGMFKAAWDGIVYIIKQPLKLLDAYFTFWKGVVSKTFRGAMSAFKLIFRGFRNIRDDVIGWVKDLAKNMPKIFDTMATAVKKIFQKIRAWIGNPIIGVVDFVINKALIGGINKLANWVGLGGKDNKVIGEISVPKPYTYATGGIHGVQPGYTPGRDNKYIPGFMVGGGEAIMRPEWTKLIGAETINAWNKAAVRGGTSAVKKLMGFAGGGIWPTRSKHFTTYAGHDGLDFNGKGNGLGAPYFATNNGRVAYTGSGRGYGNKVELKLAGGPTVIYGHSSKILTHAGANVVKGQVLGHIGYSGHVIPAGPAGSHLHFGLKGEPADEGRAALKYLAGNIFKGGGFLGIGDLFGKLSSIAKAALKSPSKYLSDLANDGLSKVKGTGGDSLKFFKAIPGKFIGAAADKIKSAGKSFFGDIKGFFGVGGKDASSGPKLYDNGGYLPPGLSMVMNKTRRPEPVLTAEQWDKLLTGGGTGDTIHVETTVNGSNLQAADVSDSITFDVRRASRQIASRRRKP